MGVSAAPLPDVSVETKVRKNTDANRWDQDVQYVCICNHGCGSYHTPDVRGAIAWADEHENSDGHLLSKWDRLGEGMQQLPRNADLKNRVELIIAKMQDANGERSHIYVEPIGGMEKHEH